MLRYPVPSGLEVGKQKTPWNYKVDLRINRDFTIGRFPVSLFVYVQNLFNRKNVHHVYLHTGLTNNDGWIGPNVARSLNTYHGKEFITLYNLINHEHRQHYQIRYGGDLFGRPREIRFGMQIGFDDLW